MRNPLSDPRPGDVVRKGKRQRSVYARRGNEVYYTTESSGLIRNCWITTWCDWCRGSEVLHVAE
jgi:hypothetical protein